MLKIIILYLVYFVICNENKIIMARRAIPMIAFPRVRTIYIYLYSTVHLRECALYT